MTIELYSEAVLIRDIPAHDLRAGDVVRVVDCHPSEGVSAAYSIEVFNTLGETIAVTSVDACDLEPLLGPMRFSAFASSQWQFDRSCGLLLEPSASFATAGSDPRVNIEHRTPNIEPRSEGIGILIFTSTLEVRS